MSVTDIKIELVQDVNRPNLVAVASCVIDNNIRLNNLKIMKRDRFRNVYLPGYRVDENNFVNFCEFIDDEHAKILFREVKNVYYEKCKELGIPA